MGTVCTLEQFKFGTVGRTLPGVEVRIAESDGEILIRGDNVFREYWNNPEATAETLVDGWLHTGDIGELDDDGYLKITGRKKDIIITAGGKNLTPANIENDLKQSPFISQAVMHGDRRPYPVALITLDPEEILPWAAEQGLPEDVEQLADADQVVALVQAEVDRANANYAQVEQIKRFAILARDLSIEDGELTPTLKVKRTVVSERYAERAGLAVRLIGGGYGAGPSMPASRARGETGRWRSRPASRPGCAPAASGRRRCPRGRSRGWRDGRAPRCRRWRGSRSGCRRPSRTGAAAGPRTAPGRNSRTGPPERRCCSRSVTAKWPVGVVAPGTPVEVRIRLTTSIAEQDGDPLAVEADVDSPADVRQRSRGRGDPAQTPVPGKHADHPEPRAAAPDDRDRGHGPELGVRRDRAEHVPAACRAPSARRPGA